MKKFEFGKTFEKIDLEIVRLATYMPGYLSKQIIIMLWANGVYDHELINMQDEYVKKLIAYFNCNQIGPEFDFKQDLFQ